MSSDEFDAFLSEVLPPIGLRPSAHRRRNIKRRIVRRMESAGSHDCRNAMFTYFGTDQRLSVAAMLAKSVEGGGYLVLGRTETLTKETADLFEPAFPAERIYRLRAGS